MPDEENSKREFLDADYDALIEAQIQAGQLKADIEIASSFEISEQQKARIEAWCKEQDAKAAHMQLQSKRAQSDPFLRARLRRGIPNYGAVGGALTYNFTPNGLGTVFNVYHAVTNEVLSLTDFDSW